MSHSPTDGPPEQSAAGRSPEPDPAWAAPESAPPGAAPTAAGPLADAPPPPGQPPLATPGASADAPAAPGQPPKRRAGLIAAASLVIVLVLCGGGGTAAFLLLRGTEAGEGAAEPVAAVDAFLDAVYTEQDAARAAALVCVEARDEAAIAEKVREVAGYDETYLNPRFRWDPPTIATENKERAIVSVKLTMTTGDEKLSDQQLRFTVVRKTGWWVCEVG